MRTVSKSIKTLTLCGLAAFGVALSLPSEQAFAKSKPCPTQELAYSTALAIAKTTSSDLSRAERNLQVDTARFDHILTSLSYKWSSADYRVNVLESRASGVRYGDFGVSICITGCNSGIYGQIKRWKDRRSDLEKQYNTAMAQRTATLARRQKAIDDANAANDKATVTLGTATDAYQACLASVK